MRKLLSLVLVLSLVFGSMSFAFAAPTDVEGTDYEDAVARLMALNVITGYEDGTFRPNNTITRAEFAAIVVRVLGLDAAAKVSKGATQFSDVTADHWASGYINVASSQKIINGMGDGTFAPTAPVTFEQAVTMIVRALGYEPAAKARGGYPTGYLVVAAQEDITDDVNGVVGAPAPRGIVAQLVDNSIEVPLMIQVGYGDEAKYVKSGTEDTDVENLLVDKLDVTKVDEIVKNIPRTESDLEDNEIELETTGVVEVLDGFDFEGAFGAEIRAYINDDVVVSYEVNDKIIYDSVTWDAGDSELDFYAEEESYAINGDAVVYVDGAAGVVADAQADADYVKVILNDDDEVIFIEAWNWDDSILVDEIDDELVIGTDESAADIELDVEDFTIVKAGKVISIEDIKEGDVLYYNEDAEYAEVYAEVVKGDIEANDVFSGEFELAGDDYTIEGTYVNADGDMDTLDSTALEDMADADDNTIKVTLNRAGLVRFVDGNIEPSEEKSTIAGYLTDDITVYESRNKEYIAIDMVNEEGAEVAYDIEISADVLGLDAAAFAALDTDSDGSYADEAALANAGTVIEVTVDEDGDVTEIDYSLTTVGFDASGVTDDMAELDDKYIESKRLSDSVVVFYIENYTDDTDDIVVTTWEDVDEFELIDTATVYFGSDNYVDYLVVDGTDAEADTTTIDVLVTEVKTLSSGTEWRVKGYVDGELKTFYTHEDDYAENTGETLASDAQVGDLITIVVDQDDMIVDDEDGGIEVAAKAEDAQAVTGISYGDNEVTIGGTTYELVSDGFVYDGTDTDDVTTAKLRDVKVGTTVTVYVDNGTFAKYIFIVAQP